MNWDNIETKRARKLYTGKTTVKVIGINPTAEQIAKIVGTSPDRIKEPDYTDKIVVYVDNGDNVAKGTFWTKFEDTPESSTGKTKYINAYCKCCYLANPDDENEQDWYSRTGLRVCKSGEEELYSFIIAWVGVNTEAGKFELPYEQICNGDISSLQAAFEKFSDNKFVCLYGVASNQYQEFYTREFGRTLQKSFNKVQWNKDFTHEYEEYVPKEAPDALETEATATSDSNLPFSF